MTAVRPAGPRRGDDKPAVVFLHGFALDARMWRPQVDALHRAYRLVLVDLPGFGPQARAVGEVAPAKELGRAMNAAGLDRAHLVGASYGASVAIDFALQHPGRVASLVLAAPMLLGRRMGIESWSRCVDLASEGDQVTAAEVWLDDDLFETLRNEESLYDEVRQIVLDYSGAHWSGKVTSVWSEPDPFTRLKDIQIPTLVVSGEHDLPSFRLMADAYAKALPNARREILRGVGHHVNLEAPDTFNELTRAFLARST
ncbi:MAG TPA: alpha/beta fold hydrolase [Labilithrix sp.]|jgi:pimeloyl-ACP methyl ester carboxylesterase|nr:alpha/beta fold hydrolase [Labilithrix sp.]